MMVVVMATLSTVERLKDDHVICCLIARELLNRRRYATRVFLCAWIHVLRICLTISYLNATTFLIGSADGPLNIMLNALAIGFLLCRNQPLVWVVLTKLENSLARSNQSRFG
ncbi:hypothetical protein SO694_00010319 [Aureococcus anophagefferens]|uniref:TLC domain-containing protein n=1 Tax=Aureococcus anophagefferens TaxID=44056 RepID=A0ABR1GFS3_AURAN